MYACMYVCMYDVCMYDVCMYVCMHACMGVVVQTVTQTLKPGDGKSFPKAMSAAPFLRWHCGAGVVR